MAVATALGLGLAAGGAFLSSKSSNKAATKAANVAQNTATENNALARFMYDRNENHLLPTIQSGQAAGRRLNALAGIGTDADRVEARDGFRYFTENSDYGFQFGEGANRVNSGYSGNGVLRSGAAMKDLERFRQDLQSGYRGEYNNLLFGQQQLGMSGASALAGVGQNYVGTVTANNNNAGTNAANAILAKGGNNPLANTLGVIGGGMYGYGR